jgi:hypothetical protein
MESFLLSGSGDPSSLTFNDLPAPRSFPFCLRPSHDRLNHDGEMCVKRKSPKVSESYKFLLRFPRFRNMKIQLKSELGCRVYDGMSQQ